jgi:hypothetical protein
MIGFFIQCGSRDEEFLCPELNSASCDKLSSEAIDGLRNLQTAACIDETNDSINTITYETNQAFSNTTRFRRGQRFTRKHSAGSSAKIYVLKVISEDSAYILVKKLSVLGETSDIVYKYTPTANTTHIKAFQTTGCADENDEISKDASDFFWKDISITGDTANSTGKETITLSTKLNVNYPALFGKFNIEYSQVTEFDDKDKEEQSYTITITDDNDDLSGPEIQELASDFTGSQHCNFDNGETYDSPSCVSGGGSDAFSTDILND